jgi:hypothetical protein
VQLSQCPQRAKASVSSVVHEAMERSDDMEKYLVYDSYDWKVPKHHEH